MKAEVLVVDDHSLIVEGICRIINNIPQLTVKDAVTSGKEALGLISLYEYDLFILDISMPDISGFELIKKIRETKKNAGIIVNTMHEEIWIIKQLCQGGINAVVLKSSDSSELTKAIHKVLIGEAYTCERFSSIMDKLDKKAMHFQPKDIPTKRELEVLNALSKGLNTHEIALELNVTCP